ncbi:MAG: mannose-1-phosphate guanylyltransferase [Deltaproteobacteria bacterium]|nr:mannose-1-phosphate guanylyltransferase [Deltaproteobacteria bacterium]
MSEQIYAVIMAGGSGTRFWPMSRGDTPKQFLRLLSSETLLQQTMVRIAPIIPPERVIVVTARAHAEQVRELLPGLPPDNLLLEPVGRNTAPCIGLAALLVRRRDAGATMAVLPADHFVSDEEEFRQVVVSASRLAAGGRLVTVGIRPLRPETGYGYLRLGEHVGEEAARFVDAFVEKPSFDTAVEYLASGHFLWNSGMFFFTPERILDELELHLPRHAAAFGRIDQAWDGPEVGQVLEREYTAMEPISIDYGVMEKAAEIAVLVGRFPWSDVGTWAALREVLPRGENDSVSMGQVVELDGRGNVLVADGGLVAALGLRDMVVVRSGDAVLVCPRQRAQEVRRVVEALRQAGLDGYL